MSISILDATPEARRERFLQSLTPGARRSVKDGDYDSLCAVCGGTGVRRFPHDTDSGRWIADNCDRCDGRGLK